MSALNGVTAAWTHPLSMATLYVIASNTTWEPERQEAIEEIDRRDLLAEMEQTRIDTLAALGLPTRKVTP